MTEKTILKTKINLREEEMRSKLREEEMIWDNNSEAAT